METAPLLLSILFGAIGGGYFIYGKKQGRLIPLVAGVALMVVPYFIPNAWAMGGVGAVFCALPFFVVI